METRSTIQAVWDAQLRLAAVVGRLEAVVARPKAVATQPRLTWVCLVCHRHEDVGESPTGQPANSHGICKESTGRGCVAEYKRLYC